MNNLMNFDGYKAVINYDPEIEMFRGEFINLNPRNRRWIRSLWKI